MNNTSEEITLYDFWKIMASHKLAFWGFFLLIFVAGIMVTVLKQPQYNYTQVIKPANYFNDSGKLVFLNLPQNIMAQIKNVYLPTEIVKYNSSRSSDSPMLNAKGFDVDFPDQDKQTGLIVIKTKGVLGNKNIYRRIFANILKQIQGGNQFLVKNVNQYFVDTVADYKRQLAYQNKLIKALPTTAGQILLSYHTMTAKDLIVKIAQTKRELSTLQISNFTSEIVTDGPAGIGKSVMLFFSMLAAFIFAGFAAFIAEFFAKLKTSDRV